MQIRLNDKLWDIGDFLRIFNICNIYILLWCLYFAQGILFEEGNLLTQLILLINVCITFYAFIKSMLMRDLPLALKVLGLLISIFYIYGLEPIIFKEELYIEMNGNIVPTFSYLRSVLISIVPIYAYYYYTKIGLLNVSKIRHWTIIFYLFSFLCFFINFINAFDYDPTSEGFTNNAGYLFLALIPSLIFFNKRPLLQYILLAISMIMILLSVKRGAIIIGGISVTWFLTQQYKGMTLNQKIIVSGLSVVLVTIISILFFNMLEQDAYFLKRFLDTTDGNSSNRDILYAQLWTHFVNLSNPFVVLFGSGANATLRFAENFAHNDWLEILTNQGIVGVILYGLYWFLYIVYLKELKQKNHSLYIALGTLFIIYFLKTFLSMSYSEIAFCAAPTFGYCFAQCDKQCT